MPPKHGILDLDKTKDKPRYQHINNTALRTSPEEVYQFIWNNAELLKINTSYSTRVERVLATSRVGPDGLILNEVLADYTQTVDTTAGELPRGIDKCHLPRDSSVQLWGGGVLVFDQFGRFRLHQYKSIDDRERQSRRLRYLVTHQLSDRHQGYGASTDTPSGQRFAALHSPMLNPQAW